MDIEEVGVYLFFIFIFYLFIKDLKYLEEVALIFKLIKKDEKLIYHYQDKELLIELLQELEIYKKEFDFFYNFLHNLLILKKYE